jgi:hypothetical protein
MAAISSKHNDVIAKLIPGGADSLAQLDPANRLSF